MHALDWSLHKHIMECQLWTSDYVLGGSGLGLGWFGTTVISRKLWKTQPNWTISWVGSSRVRSKWNQRFPALTANSLLIRDSGYTKWPNQAC